MKRSVQRIVVNRRNYAAARQNLEKCELIYTKGKMQIKRKDAIWNLGIQGLSGLRLLVGLTLINPTISPPELQTHITFK